MTELTPKPCPFCELPEERIVMSNDLATAIRENDEGQAWYVA